MIADTYTVEALIGRGGMGAVFLASHKRLPGKQVAIKVLHAELAGEEVLARFKREAEIASRLGHPNIVQVHDFNVMPDGTPYLVLEYLRGESLAQRLKGGPMPLEATLSTVRQVGSALAVAHREGIVHRDLKPQNIFLVPTEVDGRIVEIAKVLDFGISKIRGSTTVKTQDSALLGTPQYMAPEQATGQHSSVDDRTDVFAFGAIVYEMLSGQPAFSGETIPEVVFKVVYEQPMPLAQRVSGLPERITAAVHRAMAKNADERFPNVGAFVEALTGQPLASTRPGASIPPPDLGFAAGSRAPTTGQDAFAQTMGSGDHGPAAQPSADGSPPTAHVPPPAHRLGSAPTIDSQSQQLGHAGTVSAHPPPVKRKTGLIVALVLGGAVIAAVAMYVAMKKPDDSKQVAQVTEPSDKMVAADAATRAEVPVVVADAAAGVEKKAEIDIGSGSSRSGTTSPQEEAKPAKQDDRSAKQDKQPKHEDKPPKQDGKPPAVDEETDDGDEAVKKKLSDAEAALAANNWNRAEQLANAVTRSQDANARQKLRATMIFGTVQCLGRNDEGRARAELRKLTVAPKMRRKLIDACHSAGYLQNVR
ncbi:MAG TPA: protein kinase [Kofleriaceae bacterium]|nr:protein kinase [Kofleriaceae bacterium]